MIPEQKSVLLMSAGFFALFMAFTVAQAFSTTALEGSLGTIALAVLYLCFTLSCLLADLYVRLLGAKVCMVLGSIPYIAMILANLYPSPYVVIPANAACGIAAAILWTGQGVYLARCAQKAATTTGESMDKWTSSFNALFFSLFQANGSVGLLLASSILIGANSGSMDASQAQNIMFIVMGALATLGSCILAFGVPSLAPAPLEAAGIVNSSEEDSSALLDAEEIDPVLPRANPAVELDSPQPDQTNGSSALATLQLACRESRMALLVPLIFFNGASLAFLFGEYPKSVAQPMLGKPYIGFVMATFYASNTVFTYLYGKLLSVNFFTRSTLVATAVVFIGLFLTALVLFDLPTNYDTEDSELATPTQWDFLVCFGLTVVFAAGDSVLESQVPAILQSYFRESPQQLNASMGNLKLWQSLGSAYSFMIAGVGAVSLKMRLYTLLGMLLFSSVFAVILHTLKHPFQIEERGSFDVPAEGKYTKLTTEGKVRKRGQSQRTVKHSEALGGAVTRNNISSPL
eukprot:gb/GEZN01005963.1/.p1 GENE.gb/GEZN01005963.1/~~gb/GEZN01005963.1/.p1  ORF type:complete len:517 (-),score=52.01 gb/GEZN01005963.1/:135-1685(-)